MRSQLLAAWHRQFDQPRDDLDEKLHGGPERHSIDASGLTTADICSDIVDGEAGDDSSCRPNQILLSCAPAIRSSTKRVGRRSSTLSSTRLLTRYGLRTLDPGHPDFKAR